MSASEPAPVRAGCGGIVPPVEHRFRPGNSANPGGRPKFRETSNAMRKFAAMTPEELQAYSPKTGAEVLALNAYLRAQDDPRFLTHYLDRTEGKVPDELKVDSEGAGLRIVLAEATPPNTDATKDAPGVMASTEERNGGGPTSE